MFNNREIASGILLLIFTAWVLTKPDVRRSIGRLIQSFFQWKIVACVLAMLAYSAILVILFWCIGLWNFSLIKDTALWFVFSGFVMLMQFMATQNYEKSIFKSVLIDSFKLVIFLEFLIGTYVFPLWIEFLFVPLVTMLILVDTFARTDEQYSDVTKLTGFLAAAVGFGILCFAITQAIADWKNLGTINNAVSIIFPPLMSVAFVPFIIGSLITSTYENLFVRLNIGREKSDAVKRYAKSKIFRHCGLSLRKLRAFSSSAYRLNQIENKNDVDRLFEKGVKS